MLITPRGAELDAVDPGDLVDVALADGTVAADHARPAGRPRRRRCTVRSTATCDAGAIVHTHAHYCTVLSTLVDELPAIHYVITAFGGPVRVARYETFGTDALAASVTRRCVTARAALMANHGAVVAGRDIEHAVALAIQLEWLASVYYHALCAGTPRTLSAGPARRGHRARPRACATARTRRALIDAAAADALRGSHPEVVSAGTYIMDVLGRPVAELPRGQVSLLLDEIRPTPAGTAGGTAVDLARLGARVTAIGAIGRDLAGDFVVAALQARASTPRRLRRKDGVQTSCTMLPIHPDGSRPAWHVPGANSTFCARRRRLGRGRARRRRPSRRPHRAAGDRRRAGRARCSPAPASTGR